MNTDDMLLLLDALDEDAALFFALQELYLLAKKWERRARQ